MGTPLAEVFVQGRVDTTRFGPDIARGFESPTAARAASTAGAKTGAQFGSKFSAEATATGSKASAGIFAGAPKSAAVAGLKTGATFGTKVKEELGKYGKTIGASVVGFFAYEKVKELVTGLFEAGNEAQRTTQLLEAHLASTGGVANVTAQHIEALAASQSHLVGVDKDTILAGATLLTTFTNVRNEAGKGNDVFDRTIVTAENLSASLGTSLTSAMRLVGRATNDPVHGLTMLTRVGIQFTDQQKTQIAALVSSGKLLQAQGIVLDQLGVKFGGSAQAADTPLRQLTADFKTWEQDMGQRLIPLLNDAATDLVKVGGGLEKFGHLVGEVPTPIKELAGAMLALKLASGIGLTGAIQRSGVAVRGYAGFAKVAIANTTTMERVMLGARAGAFALGAGLIYLDTKLSDSHDQAKAFLDVAGGAAMGAAFGAEGAVFGAVGGLLTAYGRESSQAAAAQQALQAAVAAVTSTLDKQSGAVTAATQETVTKKLADSGAFNAASKLGLSYDTVTNAALGQKDALHTVRAALAEYLKTNGHSVNSLGAAATAMRGLLKVVLPTGAGIDAMQRRTERENIALGRLHGQANQAASTVRHMGGVVDELNVSAEANVTQTDAQTRKYHTLESAIKGTTLAQEALNNAFSGKETSLAALTLQIQSSAQATKKLKDVQVSTTGVIDTSSVAGATLAQNLAQIATTAAQVTGSTLVQKRAVEQGRQAILDQAEAAGVGVHAAQQLRDNLLAIPTEGAYKQKIDIAEAEAGARHFRASLQDMLAGIPDEPVNITLTTQDAKVLNELGVGGGITGATGGLIRGPGSGTSDSIAARLSDGEYVMRAAAVDHYGADFFHQLNGMGFADGGGVNLRAHGQGAAAAVRGVSGVLDTIGGKISTAVSDAVSRHITSIVPPGGGSTSASGPIADIVHALANARGWGTGLEWADLVRIINSESGFNPNAQNPTSTAYGLFQFLDSTWASVGASKTSDPVAQTLAGLRYIASRYGDPENAWGFHVAHGWYDHGGGLAPGLTLAENYTGSVETVTPAIEMADVIAELRAMRRAMEGAGIRTQVVNGAEMARHTARANALRVRVGCQEP